MSRSVDRVSTPIRMLHRVLTLWNLGAIFRKTQLEVMLRFLDVDEASKILDVGCGHGFVNLEILKLRPNANLVLLDLSINDLRVAKVVLSRHRLNADFVQADATYLPFRDRVFDRVLMSSVL